MFQLYICLIQSWIDYRCFVYWSVAMWAVFIDSIFTQCWESNIAVHWSTFIFRRPQIYFLPKTWLSWLMSHMFFLSDSEQVPGKYVKIDQLHFHILSHSSFVIFLTLSVIKIIQLRKCCFMKQRKINARLYLMTGAFWTNRHMQNQVNHPCPVKETKHSIRERSCEVYKSAVYPWYSWYLLSLSATLQNKSIAT